MEIALKNFLEKNKIDYDIHEHPAVFTVEESKALDIKLPCLHTKSLFLKDEHDKYFLVTLAADKRLNTKLLKTEFSCKDLRFASPEEMLAELHLTPGSVSPLAMIYAEKTTLIIDLIVWTAKEAGFHPNQNTATIILKHGAFERFVTSLNKPYRIIEL